MAGEVAVSGGRVEEQLRASEERYRLISELTSDYTYACRVDPDGRIVIESATDGFRRVTGYPSVEELEACGGWVQLIHPDDLAAARERMRALMTGQGSVLELRILTRDSQTRWIRYSAHPVWDAAAGRVVRLLGAVQDITEQKLAERALWETNRRVHDILESITDGFIALDRNWCLTYVNRRGEELVRRTRHELLGRNVWEEFPEAVGTTFNRMFLEALTTGEAAHFEEYYPPLKTWFEVHAFPSVAGLAVYFRDVTRRKQDEEDLQKYAALLQTFSRRLLEAQEAERRRLARELHDEVGQTLTGLKLCLEAAGQAPAGGRDAALKDAQALVHELIAQVRNLSLDLRPGMLDDLGLVPALVWHFQRYSAQTGVRVEFAHNGLGRRFPPEVETAAYRIAQEALTNVARHAGAAEAAVRLWVDQDRLGVQVEDRGAGFDFEAARAKDTSSGLSGMRERAALLGGHLAVETAPGGGTRVTAELPLCGPGERGPNALDAGAGR
jgi:PAS domain S-box-containing protein